MGYPNGTKQACQLRDAAAREAVALLAADPPEDAAARARRASAFAALVKAWESACERLRIARGVPLPGSRTPAERIKKARASRAQPRMDVPLAPEPGEAMPTVGGTPNSAALARAAHARSVRMAKLASTKSPPEVDATPPSDQASEDLAG
jgi:hypothetical protein